MSKDSSKWRGLGVLALVLIVAGTAQGGWTWCPDSLLQRARERAERFPWAHRIVENVLSDAQDWLKSPPQLPEVPVGYFHDYYCPHHAVQLHFDPREAHRHVCPVDGSVFVGQKYDEAWAYLVHFRSAQRLPNLALAYVFTGNRSFAEAALDWLRQIRDRYRQLPLHGTHAGRGRLMGQSLDEAVWAVFATRAYALLRAQGAITDAEHRSFARRLWNPMYELLAREPQFRGRIHNIACWHLAAMAAIAAVMEDRNRLRQAIEDPSWGLRAQAARGVDGDGLWFEGSLGYHFYALEALLNGAWVAKCEGLPLGDTQQTLVKMLSLPLRLADASGNLPSLNDGWPDQRLDAHAELYEWATAIFPEQGLDTLWAPFSSPRVAVEALLFGPEAFRPRPARWASQLLRHTGLALLREEDLLALLDFGPHGGGHGHLDKLQLLLNWRGRWLAPDFGTAGYGIPAYREWFTRTASHNAVSVDGHSQSPASGELLSFGRAGRWQFVRARCRKAFSGVDLDRVVGVAPGQIVVVDWIRSRKRHAYDWHFRADGEAGFSLPRELFRPCQLTGEGYEYYQQLRYAVSPATWNVTWQAGDVLLTLFWYGSAGDTLFLGEEPGIPMHRKYSFALVRRWAESTVFAAAFAVNQAPPAKVEVVHGHPEEPQIVVEIASGPEVGRLYLAVPGQPVRASTITLEADTAFEDATGIVALYP
ncbi:MAG: heparinase II/III family protein [candidate division KSB1 bacterium]|nr:heparinase II/III family protein [candidate division KSB1 bacterium]